MTNNNNGSPFLIESFLIEDGCLYAVNDTDARREVTHVQRLDAGGADYLKLWVSGRTVHAGRNVGDTMFTLTLASNGWLEGKVPGGYQYDFVMAKNIWADREYVLEAIRKSGWALQFADESLKADREVVLEAVRQNGHALEYAAKELQKDKELKKIVAGYAKAQRLAREWTKKHPK